jgi:hypothetical protein
MGHAPEMLESYDFNFDYDNRNFTINNSIVDVQKSTRQFIKRLLIMTQNLEPLPGNPH